MKALVIGSVVLDVIVSDVEYLARQNYNKHEAHSISMHAGGGAVNVASHLVKLGDEVSLCSAVGTDHEAHHILKRLRDLGIQTTLTEEVRDQMTGKSVVILLPNKESNVYVNRAANKALSLCTINHLDDIDWVYATSMPSVAFEKLMSLKKSVNQAIRLVMNPGMRQLQDAQYAKQIIQNVDLLCINYEEARALCISCGASLDAANETPKAIATMLLNQGVRALLMTLGAEGALYCDAACYVDQGVEPVNLVSTIGAGDAFCSTFAHYWVLDGDVEDALLQARHASALVLETVAANHLTSLDDVL